MAVKVGIDPSQRLFYWAAEGHFTESDLAEVRARMVAYPTWEPSFSILADATKVERFDLSAAFLRTYATGARARSARVAFVAPSDLGYAMGRMFEVYAEKSYLDLHVFRDMAEALRWLDIEFSPTY